MHILLDVIWTTVEKKMCVFVRLGGKENAKSQRHWKFLGVAIPGFALTFPWEKQNISKTN